MLLFRVRSSFCALLVSCWKWQPFWLELIKKNSKQWRPTFLNYYTKLEESKKY